MKKKKKKRNKTKEKKEKMNRNKATAYQKHASMRDKRPKHRVQWTYMVKKKWGVKICDKLEVNIINKQKTQG